MFPADEQTLVLLAGVALAAVSALVLISRAVARRSANEADAVQHKAHIAAAPAPRPQPQPTKVQQPAAATSIAAAKTTSPDDPYGVRATLPADASYTAIAVATAEAAARAKAASGSNSRV